MPMEQKNNVDIGCSNKQSLFNGISNIPILADPNIKGRGRDEHSSTTPNVSNFAKRNVKERGWDEHSSTTSVPNILNRNVEVRGGGGLFLTTSEIPDSPCNYSVNAEGEVYNDIMGIGIPELHPVGAISTTEDFSESQYNVYEIGNETNRWVRGDTCLITLLI